MRESHRSLGLLVALIVGMLALPGVSNAAGVSGPAFYIDGVLYRTVGTPTDFSGTGAPPSSYNIIYNLGRIQPYNVATAAPGDPGFRGGRWAVHAISFGATAAMAQANYAAALADDLVDLNRNDVLDSDEEIVAAITRGYATDRGVVRFFECTVVPLPHNR